MPDSYSGRVTLILTVLIVWLYLIVGHPSRLFNPHYSLIQKTDLKPGIDMVGGVSLIYQIQAPPGNNNDKLSEQVMDALKRRVDPNGLRNLVWRPEGADRLEIQMPMSPEAAQAPEITRQFDDARRQLEATNISPDAVIDAVEHQSGDARASALAKLAGGSPQRADLFKQLCDAYDKLQAERANPQKLSMALLAAHLQPLIVQYDALKNQIDQTNLPSDTLQSLLDETHADDEAAKAAGQAQIDQYIKDAAGFPARAKAIDDFIQKYKAYDQIKLAVTGAGELKRLLQGSGVLEFHILADQLTVPNQSDLQAMYARLEPGGKGPLPQPGDTMQWMEVDRPEEFVNKSTGVSEAHDWNGKKYMLVLTTPDASLIKTPTSQWGLDRAYPETDPSTGLAVGFSFNPAGAKAFGDLTQRWVDYAKRFGPDAKSRLAIVLDNKIVSAPALNSAITGGQGEITAGTGGYKTADANYLINTLNAGSLPAQLSNEPISEEQVGPTLGSDNLYKGLLACGFGLVVVGVFLIGYYYVAGVVAFVAVLMNLVLILGTMAALNATFTLPSIAGIVLTVGTAVDANVLIFERLREEQHKGLPLRLALRNSYQQAQSAIIDSNMTTVITSLCLYMFGSEEVKGFGLTLVIGIVASLFTALYVTKTIFGIMIDKFGVKHLGSFPLTFPKWDRALRPNWDWMGKAWIFYTFSIIAITTGLVLFVIKTHEGQMMDIEFASGTSVQFELKHPMKQEAVRRLIDRASDENPQALPSPSVVAVGNNQLHYEVVTPNIDRLKVQDAVLAAMKGELQLQLPSTFDQVGAKFTEVRNTSVLPITSTNFSVDGYRPPAASSHLGGVAIVLRHLNPPLTVQQVQQRLDNARLSGGTTSSNIEYAVQAPGNATEPTSFVVIVGWNSSVSYAIDEAKWVQDLAQPLWSLTADAVHRPPTFEKENNFDPQVAGEMQRDAFMALFFSIAAIMVYIWVRFGNLKYGTATVVALLHDTIFTLAALGFAHYIAQFWHENFLQIEPFRINLTVVAGILTIMGYSMIDTIVVFDRIRENRGKYGHLDRQVINTAINETLSRTLLTCGTTIITVSFMYFLGGAGIHGFTFVLLVGILVGTYSSVAIAAPLLLWGNERAPDHPRGVIGVPVGQLQRA